jgi:GNAT superfamily N-acetyltransferase
VVHLRPFYSINESHSFSAGNKEDALRFLLGVSKEKGIATSLEELKGIMGGESGMSSVLKALEYLGIDYDVPEKNSNSLRELSVRGKKIPEIENLEISPIEEFEIEDVIKMASLIFSNVRSYEENIEHISHSDFEKSIKVTNDGELIGCYLVKDVELPDEDGRGIEGFALALIPKYRGLGLGRCLKDWLEKYSKDNGYDYIFGLHFKELDNLDHWLKRRDLYEETEELYKTIKRN